MLSRAIFAMALAAIAQAATIPHITTNFSLSNFYFGGTPHSLLQTYTFDITDGISKNQVFCSTYSSVTPGLLLFNTTACNETTWSFSFTFANTTQPSGFFVNVTREIVPDLLNQTASRYYPNDAVQEVTDPYSPTGTYYWLNSTYQFELETELLVY